MLRMMGAAMIVAGCSSFGFLMGYHYRKEERMLKCLSGALREMEWELKYRMTPLPELCRVAARASGGKLGDLFRSLGDQLEACTVSEISGCMNGMLVQAELPDRCRRCLKNLGTSLGRYDMEGQLQGLEGVSRQCEGYLEELGSNRAERLRSYETLAICAGIALVILLV